MAKHLPFSPLPHFSFSIIGHFVSPLTIFLVNSSKESAFRLLLEPSACYGSTLNEILGLKSIITGGLSVLF